MKFVETLVIPEARAQIRIARQKSRGHISRSLQRSRDCRFVRGDPQYLTAQTERIARSHDRREREIGRRARHDGVREYDAVLREGVQERSH